MSSITSAPPSSRTLTQRLVDHYLVFGLACVFLCTVAMVLLAWHGTLLEWTAATVLLPLLILLGGAIALRRTSSIASLVEQQVCRAALQGLHEASVSPIPAAGPLAAGWNLIVGRLRDRQIADDLESKLRTSFDTVEQDRWLCLFNALSDGVAVTDAEFRIVRANAALAALLNLNDGEAVQGVNLIDRLQAVLPQTSRAQVDGLKGGSGGGSRELLRGAQAADGVLRVTRASLGDETFGPGAVLWTLKDVTQQKLAEAMRNQFVSTATHELRTPLTNIVAYSELLADKETVDVEQQQKFCNIINSEASRLSRFIDQMLNVSQMESGALTLARHETDLMKLVDDVTIAVTPQAVQKSLTFNVHAPAKLPKLRIDKDKITAALVNLLGNAVKYTPDGGTVGLKIEETTDALLFHVDDTGIGIEADELSQIGTKFFRSADSRVREITGSGLGLAFAHEVARLHGGRIMVVSELNKGSRFTLALPLR